MITHKIYQEQLNTAKDSFGLSVSCGLFTPCAGLSE